MAKTVAKRFRRTKEQIKRDGQILFDAIKTGVVEGHYAETKCVRCGAFTHCAGRNRHNMRCRDCIR